MVVRLEGGIARNPDGLNGGVQMTDTTSGTNPVPMTSTKARNGGIASAIVSGVVSGLIQGVENAFMIDIPVEVEMAIIAMAVGGVTSFVVWLWPNTPKVT